MPPIRKQPFARPIGCHLARLILKIGLPRWLRFGRWVLSDRSPICCPGRLVERRAAADPREVEHTLKSSEAIICSMTVAERRDPDLLNASRRRRIASGSGTSVQDVNRLIKQFRQAQKLLKVMKGASPRKMDGNARMRPAASNVLASQKSGKINLCGVHDAPPRGVFAPRAVCRQGAESSQGGQSLESREALEHHLKEK